MDEANLCNAIRNQLAASRQKHPDISKLIRCCGIIKNYADRAQIASVAVDVLNNNYWNQELRHSLLHCASMIIRTAEDHDLDFTPEPV